MKIAVVGTGYVGLVTGTCLAETGNDVTCVDIDQEKIEKMKGGIVPIYEPHLDVLFHRNIKQGRLRFTTDLKEAVESAKVIFLALPTPPGEDGSADLSYVLNAAREIGPMINEFKVIVDKSTVPVGTADLVKAEVAKDAREQFAVVSNPEFLREGFAVDDFMKPDRVVVGTSSEKAKKVMEELYKPFIRQGNPLIFMDERSAELTKYAANAFLAAKITFMNEIANFCELVGADVDKVRLGIGTDERIGKRFLFPGIGYGGSCFPKDVLALQHSGQKAGMDFQILDAVLAVNNAQRLRLMAKVEEHFGKDLKGKHFALWGLAFKPDTDDIREAPALYMVDALLSKGAKVTAFDPEAMENVKKSHGDKIQLASNEYEALEGTDALIIATEWSVFRNPDFNKVKTLMPSHTIFDGRNLYDLETMRDHGFTYYSIGRKLIK
ncbi:MAG: UDP-glucose/GDP-mannose dehydrogenase family protein [Bacteroidetes bacterium]|nr:UDP-glucose/GDP-mannose dehydrogenase family protein [Bacteroidota bacterium]